MLSDVKTDFEAWLDEKYGIVSVAGEWHTTSTVLLATDPDRYYEMLIKFITKGDAQ